MKQTYLLSVLLPQNTTTVTVMVTDVNDHTPQCDQNLFAFTAAEANILRVQLGQVTATDGDSVGGVGSGQLSYRLGSTNLQNNITVTSDVSSYRSCSTDHHACTNTFRAQYLVSLDWTLKSWIQAASGLM